MKERQFDILIDNDNIEILDWIRSHFENGNSHKQFEVTVQLKEIDHAEDGRRIYVNDYD